MPVRKRINVGKINRARGSRAGLFNSHSINRRARRRSAVVLSRSYN